jgi:hypothetical protein
MTICAAALAASSRAIVCIADKALTFGDGTMLQAMTWDSDSTKIVPLNQAGMVCLFAGGEDGISRVLSKFLARDTFGKTSLEIRSACEADYKESIKELVEIRILHPHITYEQYVSVMSRGVINPVIKQLSREVNAFDFNCEMLVCGFDSLRKPFIHYAVSKGVVDDMARTGFQAIGSGWPYVHARLLWSEYERKNDIHQVLYEIFDAKANAEMDPSVGYEWDAVIILGGKLGAYAVPDDIKKLIEEIWEKYNRSPFKKQKKEVKPSLKKWPEQLQEFSLSVLSAGTRKSTKLKRLS